MHLNNNNKKPSIFSVILSVQVLPRYYIFNGFVVVVVVIVDIIKVLLLY